MSPDRVFEAHRGFVEELVAWRRDLGLAPGSGADRSAAWLLHHAFLHFAFRWREEAARLRSEAAASAAPAAWLAREASLRLLEALEGEPADEARDFLIRRHRERVEQYNAALAGGPPVEAHGVPEERLPEWYFLAQPENRRFREAFP